MLGIFIKLKEK